MQGAVELAVAAAVEPVAPVLAGAGFERRDAGVAGELRIGVEALDRPISPSRLALGSNRGGPTKKAPTSQPVRSRRL